MESDHDPLVQSYGSIDSIEGHGPKQPRRRFVIPVFSLVLLYLVLTDLGYELISPAQTRVFEQIFCKLYYQGHEPRLANSFEDQDVDEKLCKVTPVQKEVAMLKGWQLTFDSIGSKSYHIASRCHARLITFISADFLHTMGFSSRYAWS